MIGKKFVIKSALSCVCGDLDMIFTCIGSLIAGDNDLNPRVVKIFCGSDRQKLRHAMGEKLFIIRSDTGKIRLMSAGEIEKQTVDVTEKIEKKVFDKFYPGEVIVYNDDNREARQEFVGARVFDKGGLKVGTVSHRCLDKNFRLHVRIC